MTEGQDTEGLGFDFHCPVGSLARIFRRSLSAFDGQTGQYLQADPARVAELQALHVKSVKPRLQCGITWRSRSEKNGLERSMALQDLVQALHQDGLEFINLQYGDTAAEVEACFQSLGIRVKSLSEVDHFSDLEGLAASIACCDLVITVDNSTAHLAGALGKKTWVLLTHTPDWRWMLDREDSPWYAALQLYRQGADRRWGPVLERVNQDLQKNLCSFSLPSVQSPATS
jgi:ADP-heptose:LPS heptosyltransferase